MDGVFAIFLGLLYVICILFCWSYINGENPSEEFEEHLNDLKTKKINLIR
jgi:hypothetical protein